MESATDTGKSGQRMEWTDVFMLLGLRAYTFVAVAVTAGLLLLSILQFYHAFRIGFSNVMPKQFLGSSAGPKGDAPMLAKGDHAAPPFQSRELNATPSPSAVVTMAIGTNISKEVENIDLGMKTECARQKEIAKEALVFAIHGLEFLLFAPICFVFTRSLCSFISNKYVIQEGPSELLATVQIQSNRNLEVGDELKQSKALLVGLLSSLVGVDIVSRILESEQTVDHSMWIMIAVLGVLGAYYIALERLAKSK